MGWIDKLKIIPREQMEKNKIKEASKYKPICATPEIKDENEFLSKKKEFDKKIDAMIKCRQDCEPKKVLVEIPKKYKLLEISVGDQYHEPTQEQINKLGEKISYAIKHKKKVVVVPYWVKLRVVVE